MAIQTPKQRLANEKFNKNIEKHRKFGKAKPQKSGSAGEKPQISAYWMYALLFLLVGGGLLELLSHLI